MKDYQQMDLFSKTQQSKRDDDNVIKMERGHAYIYNDDFPDDFVLTFDLEVLAYETDLETGNEEVVNKLREIRCCSWSDLQKRALELTNKWSRGYDHISVTAKPRDLSILEYFGD